jgi:hypothetical protein
VVANLLVYRDRNRRPNPFLQAASACLPGF